MHILFLTTQLPYPPKSGGLIKSWNLVEHWSREHELSLIHPLKNDDALHLEEFKDKVSLRSHFHVEVQRGRSALNLVKSYLGHATLNIYRNYDREIKSAVESIAHTADVIFLDHYEMGQYVPYDYHGKVVLHEHNAEYVMWDRLAQLDKNPIKKLLLKMEAKRILRTELRYADNADLVLAAPNDIQELVSKGADEAKMRKTYHLGEDFMLESPDMEFEDTDLALLYIGTLSWEANVDGLLWFIRNCWSTLKQKHSALRLTIVGKNPDARLKEAVSKTTGIAFTGFVEDLEECYSSHRVYIVPLRFGSGIKVKVLNALYRGIPLVTTDIGTEGLDVVSGKELYEVNSENDFTDKVSALLTDKVLWTRMRDASRLKAKEFTWAHLLAQHDAQLEELVKK